MSAGAVLMLFAGVANLLVRVKRHIFPSFAKSSIASAAVSENDDDSCADTTELAMAITAWKQTQQRRAASASPEAEAAPVGGDVAPARSLADAYPSLHSVAVDPDTNQVVMSDSNRGAIFFYDRVAGNNSSQMVTPNRIIRGPRTG